MISSTADLLPWLFGKLSASQQSPSLLGGSTASGAIPMNNVPAYGSTPMTIGAAPALSAGFGSGGVPMPQPRPLMPHPAPAPAPQQDFYNGPGSMNFGAGAQAPGATPQAPGAQPQAAPGTGALASLANGNGGALSGFFNGLLNSITSGGLKQPGKFMSGYS